jgi:Flp pilus assembly protein TadG
MRTAALVTNPNKKCRGVFVILLPFVLVALMGLSALIVDGSMLRVSHNQLQTATDSAALAAASQLPNGTQSAHNTAMNMINKNTLYGGQTASNVQITYGIWDNNTHTFVANNVSPTAVKVTADATMNGLFAKVFSSKNYTLSTVSIASLLGGPRDIVFVVDLSTTMNEYSQLSAIGTQGLTQANVINNLQQIYNALSLAQIGSMQWNPVTLTGNSNSIQTTLGLTNGNYPYPSGSWGDYINYIKNDNAINAAGYRNKYGYLTFMNYLLTQQPKFNQTPALWKTPEKPLQSVKTSISSYISTNTSNADELALVVFNGSSGGSSNAVLEQHLTTNFNAITSILNGNPSTNTAGRQAAHYNSQQNSLSPALSGAVDELNNNGRQGSQKIIFVLTTAQFSNNGFNSLMNEALAAANDKITINIIAIGTQGNTNGMQQIATATGGTESTASATTTDYSNTLGQMSSISGSAELVQ